MWLVVCALVALLVLASSPFSYAHECMHDSLYDVNDVMSVEQVYAGGSYPFLNNTLPIRMRVDTTYLSEDLLGLTCTQTGQRFTISGTDITCGGSDLPLLTSSLRSYLNSLLDQAKDLFQTSLRVIPVNGSLQLTGSSSPQGLSGGVYVSSEYTNGVPDTDVVIFVTARPIVQSGGTTSTLAVARVVQEDQIGRPIMGHLNINPGGIDVAAAMFKRNFGVVIHEMTHALGFTIGKLRNVNPHPITGITNIVTPIRLNVAANDTANDRNVVTSPRVVEWARNYFGCSTVRGVELENQGGSGTELSHWEKRTVFNEYMTGTASRNPVFSELTLALLEDAGWYVANYSRAGQLLWGHGMGCDFTNRGCDKWPKNPGYFCSENNAKGCTADYQAKGSCQIGTGTVSTDYQYFPDNPTKVGFYDLPDFCPVTWGFENGWCFDSNAVSSSLVDKGEVFGENSRCFDSSLVKDLPLGGGSDATCYETYCTAPNELRLKIGDYWYLCPPGSEIKIVGFGGVVKCPSRIQQICAGSATDTTWPIFSAISPNSGGPGLRVNISGKNFVEGTVVRIGDPLTQVTVHSSTLISATIPNSDRFKNPTNLIEQDESVVITDPKGRSTVGYKKFTIKVKLNKEFIKNALEYLKDNPLILAAIIGAIVITCGICGFCCYRQKGKAEEADTQEYYA